MDTDRKQITEEDIFKSNINLRRIKFNALKLLFELNLPDELDVNAYTKYTIPKKDGTSRVLFEPKPLLKEIQKQLLNLLYTLRDHHGYSAVSRKVKSKYLTTKSSTAYMIGCSVVKNANFHIGKDIVLKLDISNFFNSIPKIEIESFWSDILSLKAKYLIHIGIFGKDETEENKRLIIKELVKKVLSATTLNNSLPQGSPTSGHIANSYLVTFDKRMLDYCVRKGLSYSRYSDDITISGSTNELVPENIIKFVQLQLHKKSLRLNKTKTKVIKKNKRQTVTGIVVNEKRSAGRTYKRSLRMEMYFLKKFGLKHISRTHKEPQQYLRELAGKINWVLQVNKVDSEFKRYKGELSIIKRFFNSKKPIIEAVEYIKSLENPNLKINDNTVCVAGLYWCVSDNETQNDVPTFVRRNKNIQLFTDKSINLVLQKNAGWRLPTTEEFKNYIKETNYDDRRLLGIRYSFDPHFNGLADENGYRYYNRAGLYWTSDIDHLPREKTTIDRIARKAVCFLSSDQKVKKKLNLNHVKHISNKVFTLSVNKKQKFEMSKFCPIDYYLDPTFQDSVNSFAGACSIRLVKSTDNEQENNFQNNFWRSIFSSKFSADLSELKIIKQPFPLKNYKASSLLLSNNRIREINLTESPPVKRIDLRNNNLTSLNLNFLPNGLKHLHLEGNSGLNLTEIPWKKLFSSAHEFTTDELFSESPQPIDQIYLSALKGESWLSVGSDQELDRLIDQQTHVDFLKIRIVLGSNEIISKDFFKRLSKIKVEHLFIEIEPMEEKLNKLLQELKTISGSTKTIKEYLKSIDWQTQSWFMKEYVFIARDLKNQTLKSLILDLSWLPNIKFIGDFEIKPDLYHLLHAGISFSTLPATSSEFHRPNILIKILGEKNIDEESTGLVVYYPLDPLVKSARHQKIQTIIPINQTFIDELVLVISNENEREQRSGKIEEHFPKAHAIKQLNSAEHAPKSTINLVQSKRVSGFPLLGFALHFDVHKLGVPLESFYKRDRIVFNPYRNGSVMMWSTQDLNKIIHTEKKTHLNRDNQLSELDIFSHKTIADSPQIPPETNKQTNRPYVIKKGVFASHNLYSSSLESRKTILNMLEMGEIEAKHLPSKLKDDEEVMLVAIKRNPYSMIFASRRLKENTQFILKACEISFRTLVFLPKKLVNQIEKPESALNQLATYLMSCLKPAEYNFVINKLGTHISLSEGEYPVFNCETSALDKSQMLSSFELEVFYQDKSTRAGMPNNVRSALLNAAVKRSFFNNNGYCNTLQMALLNKTDCRHLDLSFSGYHHDLSFLELFKNLESLNLSYTSVNCKLPYLPSLEILNVDYVKGFFHENEPSFLSTATPNLRILHGRDTFFQRIKDVPDFLKLFPKIEKLDLRPYFYTKDKELTDFQEYLTQQETVIDVPIKTPN